MLGQLRTARVLATKFRRVKKKQMIPILFVTDSRKRLGPGFDDSSLRASNHYTDPTLSQTDSAAVRSVCPPPLPLVQLCSLAPAVCVVHNTPSRCHGDLITVKENTDFCERRN